LVVEETVKFQDWLQTMEVYPTIIALKAKAAAICDAELKKTLSHLGPVSDEQRQSLEVLLNSVTQKLLHDPIIFLKRDHSMKMSPHRELDLVRRLFNLDLERETEEPEE
jgi:glutamyl-tRNA reductase